jgi:hypothetical protein
VRAFCTRLASVSNGSSLRVIIAEARKLGVILNTHSAATVRDGPLAEILAGLQSSFAAAANIATVAQDGCDLTDASLALLQTKIFESLQHGNYNYRSSSQTLARLQADRHRARKLALDEQTARDQRDHRAAALALSRQKLALSLHHESKSQFDGLRKLCGSDAAALEAVNILINHLRRMYPTDDPSTATS